MPQIVFLTRVLTHYRVPFHEAVREKLARSGVVYRLLYGRPAADEAEKNDLASLDWAEPLTTFYFGRQKLAWLRLPRGLHPDLTVIGQENRNLNNYFLQVGRLLGGSRVAFFGHGKNFQAQMTNSFGERFKRFWIDKVDWWFAYTERSADVVAASGFPRSRITVFNNSIDTSSIRSQLSTITSAEKEQLRSVLTGGSANVGVYIGGLYEHKRIHFLLEAAHAIRARVPDFHLLIVGGGVDAPLAQAAASQNSWIQAVGPKFGREKTLLASLGTVFLMPGLVGLSVLDSFAYGMPMVTTDLSYHSPEIEYLIDGVNGVVVHNADSVAAYAAEVTRVLTDAEWRRHLQAGAAKSLETYTVEAMAERFSEGLLRALA